MIMKKLLGIVVLGLLICENVFAGVEEVIKEIKKNKDIAQGFNKVYEYEKKINGELQIKKYLKVINHSGSMSLKLLINLIIIQLGLENSL